MVIRPLARLQRNEGIIEGNYVSLPGLIMRFMQTLNELGSKEGGTIFRRLTRQSSMRLITYGKKVCGRCTHLRKTPNYYAKSS